MLDGVCEPAVAIATELELCDASIFIGKYEFAGPFDKPADIAEERGVFAVLCYHDREYELLDIGFADNLRKALMGIRITMTGWITARVPWLLRFTTNLKCPRTKLSF